MSSRIWIVVPAKNVVRTGNYPTLDCDGYRAVRSILPQTAKRGIEFGGFLYQNSNGRYSYSNPVAGAPTSIPDLFKVPQSLVSSPLTVYVFDAFGRLAAEYANGNSWQRDYIFDGTGFVFASENPSGSACTTCYFGYDHLGSVRIVMDGGGNVVARHDYLPFGEEISGSAGRTTPGFTITGDSTTQRFTGQIRDQESGEDYFNARYFTATLGRFNSPDPMNAGASLGSSQSWNGYAYVLGNPLALVDPSGMDTCADGSWASVCVTANLPGWFSTWNFSWFYNAWRPTSQSNGGGSGSKSPANTTPPAKNDIIHALACSAAITTGTLGTAQITQRVAGVGVAGSAGAGFLFGNGLSIGVQIVADPKGNVGISLSGSSSILLFGAGAMVGGQGTLTNATDIRDLNGLSVGLDVSAGAGPAVDVGVQSGSSPNWEHIVGPASLSGTVGVGVGTKMAALSGGGTKVWPLSNCGRH